MHLCSICGQPDIIEPCRCVKEAQTDKPSTRKGRAKARTAKSYATAERSKRKDRR